MTATIIPTFIILLLGIVLGAVVGSLWGLCQHRHIYDWLSASLISRMQRAMRSCGYSQDEIDRVTDCMGCRIMPPDIPCPPAPEKQPEKRDFAQEPYTHAEVLRRLAPHGERAGEWYCSSRQPWKAWHVTEVSADGRILAKTVHDMRSHKVFPIAVREDDTLQQLTSNIIRYNFRFLNDFDCTEWDK